MISKLTRMLVENSFPAKTIGLNKSSPLLLLAQESVSYLIAVNNLKEVS